MAAPVTYNGVASASGGNIFGGTRFWVAQRVPMRPSILSNITSNGGIIEPLEKNAEILIADHARKDAPAGSCSWKFITESIDNGCMQLQDRYLKGPTAPTTAGRSKFGRTAFTHADDVALAKWVLSHERRVSGNAIYQQFETINPRHPWNSWRARFTKNLSKRGSEELQKLASQKLPADYFSAVEQAAFPDQGSTSNSASSNETDRSERVPKTPLANSVSSTPRKALEAVHSPYVKDEVESGQVESQQATSETESNCEQMKLFYNHLEIFYQNRNKSIETEHFIGDKVVSLWELSTVVNDHNVPLDEVDWTQVAGDLGLECLQGSQIPLELQRCFQANLSEFFEAVISALDQDEGDEAGELDERPESSAPGPSVQGRGQLPEAPATPATPTPASSQKRSQGIESRSNGTAERRRRLTSDAEIPETPGPQDGYRSRLQSSELTPTSVLYTRAAPHRRTSSADKDGRLLPSPSIRNASALEDRTPSPQRSGSQENQCDVTPSQQLRSEAMNVSPIPFHAGTVGGEASARETRPLRTSTPASVAPANETARKRRYLPASFGPLAKRHRLSAVDETQRTQQQSQQSQIRETDESQQERYEQESEDGNCRRIRECVEYYETLGFPNRIVVDALKRTTMIPGELARLVMQSLKDGQGVPANYEGVWTDRDDQMLRYADQVMSMEHEAPVELSRAAKELGRLKRKHGPERVELRRRFLRAATDGPESRL